MVTHPSIQILQCWLTLLIRPRTLTTTPRQQCFSLSCQKGYAIIFHKRHFPVKWWKHRPGHPPKCCWLDQIRDDSWRPPADVRRDASCWQPGHATVTSTNYCWWLIDWPRCDAAAVAQPIMWDGWSTGSGAASVGVSLGPNCTIWTIW